MANQPQPVKRRILLLLILGLFWDNARWAVAQAPPILGSISGVVTDQAGQGIAGIFVQIYVSSDHPGQWNSLYAGYTNLDGSYSLGGLAPTDYRVGFSDVRQGLDRRYATTFYGGATLAEASNITVPAANAVTGINAQLTLLGRLRGQIVDVEGNPIRDLDVTAWADDRPVQDVTTDATGYYDIGLDPGFYRLSFARSSITYVAEYNGDALRLEQAVQLEVRLAVTTTLPTTVLTRYGVITGHLTNATERPVGGIRVTALSGLPSSVTADPVRGYTDRSGQFTLPKLLPGQYKLLFEDQRIPPHYATTYYQAATTADAATPLTVTLDQITTADSQLATIPASLPFTVLKLTTAATLPNAILATVVAWVNPASVQQPSLLYSGDGGKTWSALNLVGLDTRQVALAPRPENDQPVRILVGSWYNGEIWRSGDLGSSWAQNSFPLLPECQEHYYIPHFVSSPVQPASLYFTYQCTFTYGGFESQTYIKAALYHSNDAGISWQLRVAGPTDSSQARCAYEFAISPTVPGRLYCLKNMVSQGQKLLSSWERSDDQGITWTHAFSSPIGSLTIDWENSQLFYLLDQHQAYLPIKLIGHRSRDGGNTWQEWSNLPCPKPVEPYEYPHEAQLVTVAGAAEVVWILCPQDALYRSRDAGDTWEQLTTLAGSYLAADYGNPGRLLWAKEDGLYASSDQGDTWSRLTADYSGIEEDHFAPVLLPLFLPAIYR